MTISPHNWILGLVAVTGLAFGGNLQAQDGGADLGGQAGGVVESAGNAVSGNAQTGQGDIGSEVQAGAEAAGQVAPPTNTGAPSPPNLTESIEGSAQAQPDTSIDAVAPNLNEPSGNADVDANVDAGLQNDRVRAGARVDANADARMRDRDGRDRDDFDRRDRDDFDRRDRDDFDRRDRDDFDRRDRDNDRSARWRFVNQNGVWWYWTPTNYWMVYRNGGWNRYNGPGYGHGGTWYDNYQPRTTTGYRGSPYNNGYYYRDNDGMRFYYDNGRRYYYDNNGRYYFDGSNRMYDRRFVDPGAARGAGIGAGIGGAIGGRDGAQIGAGIGAAIGSDR